MEHESHMDSDLIRRTMPETKRLPRSRK